MEQVNQIKKRLNKEEKKSKIISFFTVFLAFLSIALGCMIYMKKDQNGTFLKENFNIDVSFEPFNSKVNGIIDSLFKLELNKDKNEAPVSNNVYYIEKGNNLFETSDNGVNMLDGGVILGVYEDKELYTVLVSYNNGVLASYSNLEEVIVKQYDTLDKGDNFAFYNQEFKAVFKKNNNLITYNEAIA